MLISSRMNKLWSNHELEYYATMKEMNSQTGKRHEVTLNACS